MLFRSLFAPFLPFTTDTVWEWYEQGSVHAAAWPKSTGAVGDDSILDATFEVLSRVRRAKTEGQVSQRHAVEQCVVHAPAAFIASLEAGKPDLIAAGSLDFLITTEAPELTVDVTLAPKPVA